MPAKYGTQRPVSREPSSSFLTGILVWTTTNRLADSATQIEFLEDQKIAGKGKIALLGNGSVRGIRTDRFHIDTVLAGSSGRQWMR